MSLEDAFNHRKLLPAFDENTGEIYLPALGKLVSFEKAVRKDKIKDNSIRLFHPNLNRDLAIGDALERAILDKSTGMVIDVNNNNNNNINNNKDGNKSSSSSLLSIKEAVKRGILSISGAPLVTGHHDSQTTETPVITTRKLRHTNPNQYEDMHHHQSQSGVDEILSTSTSSSQKSSNVIPTKKIRIKQKHHNNNDNNNENSNSMMYNINKNDQNVITTVKTSNEERRKKITQDNEVTERVKGDYREEVFVPGEKPKVTSQSNYQNEIKHKLPPPPPKEA